MLNLIVGHRGTGKSHWLRLIKDFYKRKQLSGEFFDLDEEIEKFFGQSVFDLLKNSEDSFRQKEKEVFKKIINSIPKNKECFLSVGAGFVFEKEPSWNVIYLSRRSDKMGRVFLNRPQLNPSQNPFTEYELLYKKRKIFYEQLADEQLSRREYFKHLEDSDLLFLGLKKLSQSYFTLRLDPEHTPQNEKKLKTFLQKRLNWGLRFFELHDQTAGEDFIQKVRQYVPEDKILFSSQFSKKFYSLKNKKNWSWDLSLGSPPEGVSILALHNREGKDLKTVLKEFSAYKNYHLKLAVEIFNLKELKTAYDWQCEDSDNRSFLPRSPSARWLWFRQAFGPKMFLHFIKERDFHNKNKFEVLDQPFLSEALPFIQQRKALAGVLGDPIQFSATPAEQDHFFNKQNSIPVLPLLLKEEEMTKENLKILKDLGFVFFAVTSPLKNKAFLSADVCHKSSEKFKTANTLIFHKNFWQAFNTDGEALKSLESYSSKNTVVWGGGGTKAILKKYLPLARLYSARTAKSSSVEEVESDFSPKTVIWAVGRKRIQQGCLFPPAHWNPSQVIDINYTEDSPGLEYALQKGADYINGFDFFKAQAQKQRDFFLHLKNL